MKATEKKSAYGEYTPSAQKQAHIDELIRKAIGKGAAVEVTEKHYNPWVRSCQKQLEEDLERTWSRDPLVPVEAKVTRRLRGERERVN